MTQFKIQGGRLVQFLVVVLVKGKTSWKTSTTSIFLCYVEILINKGVFFGFDAKAKAKHFYAGKFSRLHEKIPS